jgi:nucleotide-binding universal stress UspA family protein
MKGKAMTRILVPTDFSEASRAAVRYAIDLTNSVRGKMLLLHVIEGEPLRGYVVRGLQEFPSVSVDVTGNIFPWQLPRDIIRHDLYEEAEWKLSALLPPGLRDRSRTLVAVGRAADEIVKVAGEQKADLIVMGTHGRKGLRHFLRRSVAHKVIRKAPIPVITLWGLDDAPFPHHWVSELGLRQGPGKHTKGRRGLGELCDAPRGTKRSQQLAAHVTRSSHASCVSIP